MGARYYDLFESLFKDFDGFIKFGSGDLFPDANYPPMNSWVEEDTKDLFLEFAVAGIPEEKISIDVEGDYVIFEVDATTPEKEGFKLLRKGIKTGKVKNKFYIPTAKYDTANIKAALQDGILAIRIPAQEATKPKRVQIEYKT